MSKHERCSFHTKCDVTKGNKADVERIMRVANRGANVMPGDHVTLDYHVDITYLGEVADNLEAMLRLKGQFVGDQSSTDVLIKRVFKLFDKAIK